MADVHHFSQATFDRLSAELEELTNTSRIDIALKIQTVRELGALSENGDYHAAKEEQGKMEARIRDLQALLLDAEIIEAPDADSVSVGHVVAIRYEDDVLTPGSPLGQALIGKRVGDWVPFVSPTGHELKVEIVEIEA